MEQKESTLSQLMFSLIEVWKGSGMTQKEFCIEKQIAYPKFQYWIKKYSLRAGAAGDFVAVKVKSSQDAVSSGVEIRWPDGRQVFFHSGVEASFLKTLLS